MDTDSSGPEEEKERFKETTDLDFSMKIISDNSKAVKNTTNKEGVVPSLQNLSSNKTGSIKVPAEFHKYVSKHLSKILDESIVHVEKKLKVNECKKIISGIKLLKKSKYYVLPFENNAINTQPRRKIFRKRFKNKDIQQRALEVAVSGEWVLSQKETEHWATNNKGKVEIIKY